MSRLRVQFDPFMLFALHHTNVCSLLWLQMILLPGVQCQLCPMTFSDQSAISAHYDTAHAQSNPRAPLPPRPEHPDAQYPCEFCGRKFTQRQGMRLHVRTVHGVGDVKTFRCDVCSRVFKRKGSLAGHLLTVHGLGDVKSFPCDFCSYVAKRKGDLNIHVRRMHRQ